MSSEGLCKILPLVSEEIGSAIANDDWDQACNRALLFRELRRHSLENAENWLSSHLYKLRRDHPGMYLTIDTDSLELAIEPTYIESIAPFLPSPKHGRQLITVFITTLKGSENEVEDEQADNSIDQEIRLVT